MWLRHWDLRRDPFRTGSGPFVPLPGHEEAVARIVHHARAVEPRIVLQGMPGIGKSSALTEAFRRLRHPMRRLALIRRPADGSTLLEGLGAALGIMNRPITFSQLLDAARLLKARGVAAVIAVDGLELLDEPADRRVLDRIEAVGRQSGAAWTLVVAGHDGPGLDADATLAIRFDRLTRGEAEVYLIEKLRAAGRIDSTFNDRALLRLHAIAGGVPGAIDRLAGLALRAAAVEGREMVPAMVVEGVAAESEGPRSLISVVGPR